MLSLGVFSRLPISRITEDLSLISKIQSKERGLITAAPGIMKPYFVSPNCDELSIAIAERSSFSRFWPSTSMITVFS